MNIYYIDNYASNIKAEPQEAVVIADSEEKAREIVKWLFDSNCFTIEKIGICIDKSKKNEILLYKYDLDN